MNKNYKLAFQYEIPFKQFRDYVIKNKIRPYKKLFVDK